MSSNNGSNKLQILSFFLILLLFIYIVTITAIGLNTIKNDDTSTLTYTEVKNSLFNGDKLRIVMKYKYMDFYFNNTKMESPGYHFFSIWRKKNKVFIMEIIYNIKIDEVSGFDLEDYQYFARGVIGNKLEYIITSFVSLVVHPTYGSIYDYGKVRIFETGDFEIIVYFLDAVTYK